MAVENHPLYAAWNEALQHLVEAERRYHIAMMERRPDEEIQRAARDLDAARETYRGIADRIEGYADVAM
ncbi:MAG: hypothetical protein ACRED5_17130 [Propylenella sp.]